ncbi:Acyltransferase, WS/DGAT/MGAT [Desulfamplus magnetovallimortis]|uniref:diacylglycerol O-acyltransferase n=1 Tax=Desulfamplus magnetovallimortis TaxID=1246637 RepID=A0A1W1HCN8_9BACT|nr:wax ester/triacylglycerol synthase family O-acyltransferase [Desulfamplus magnetovallimortis]SLM30203.1 Acyltransferase, WS/DGAT/MGAT [Desulfamplus magnetovallimortis]
MPETMTNADNFWLCMDEPVNLMVITSVMEFEEVIDYNRLYATIDTRLACFPRFKKKVEKPLTGIGTAKWVTDKHFDLRSHLHRIALPAPGDKAELQEVISTLKTKSLDYNKPLWDIHLIENYGKGCALFFRIHHCIADGIALVHVLLSTADTDPNAPWPEAKPAPSRRPSDFAPLFVFNSMVNNAKEMIATGQKMGKSIIKEVEKCVTSPSHLLDWGKLSAAISSDAAKVLSKHTIMTADPKTAFKGKLGVQKRVTWTDPIPLDNIKKVGKAISTTTLNDVLVATVTGAMRRYLKTRNTPVNELDLHVAVPVNVRRPGTEFELGNKFSLVFLRLPVYLEDPVLRLKEVKRRMDELKASPDPYINFGLLSTIGALPSKLAQKAAQVFGNKASGVLTNVPGPREPLYFAGKQISNFMFWVPRSGAIGLGVSIMSYNGNVTIGIASDEKLMPDPDTLLEGVADEFNELIELVHSGKIYDEPLVINDRYQEAKALLKKSADSLSKNGKNTKKVKEKAALLKITVMLLKTVNHPNSVRHIPKAANSAQKLLLKAQNTATFTRNMKPRIPCSMMLNK